MMASSSTPADRLLKLMQSRSMHNEQVAIQLGWTVEQLVMYLSTANKGRQQTLTAPEMENAVEKLLQRYEIVQAAHLMKRSPTIPFNPLAATMRRVHAAPQLARYHVDHHSIIQPSESTPPSHHRKRRREALVQPLKSIRSHPLVRLQPLSDSLCPIRVDLDVDGVRYQDSLLINSGLPSTSPDEIAAQTARDEQLSIPLQDAIAESIRRQLINHTSFVAAPCEAAESLHPIRLDLIINGFVLQDQFEWDVLSDLNSADVFATTLCADLNLPLAFESAIAFSIREQVCAYRHVLHRKDWIGNVPPTQQKTSQVQEVPSPPTMGIQVLNTVDVSQVLREPESTVLWQPVLSELSQDELQYLHTKTAILRQPTTTKQPTIASNTNAYMMNGKFSKRFFKPLISKENRAPRPINPFIKFCQIQKDQFHGRARRSAAESRKIMGDMWRKMTDEEKEVYAQLTEVENEKRKRDHVFELRDRLIAEWEEEEARRLGILGSSFLDVPSEHVRGLLLQNYLNERHEVDANRVTPISTEGVEVEEVEEDDVDDV